MRTEARTMVPGRQDWTEDVGHSEGTDTSFIQALFTWVCSLWENTQSYTFIFFEVIQIPLVPVSTSPQFLLALLLNPLLLHLYLSSGHILMHN